MTPLPSHRSRARPSARAWHGSRRRGRTLAGLCCVVALLCLQAGPAHAFDGATDGAASSPNESSGASPKSTVEPLTKTPPLPDVDPDRVPSTGGRVSLVISTSMIGAGLGAEICSVSGCGDDERRWMGSVLVGAATGFATSFGFSQGGVAPATAASVAAGAHWGTFYAYTIAGTTPAIWRHDDQDDDNRDLPRGVVGGFIAGQVGGMAAGYALDRAFQPTVGSVAMAELGGAWLFGLTAWGGRVAIGDDASDGALQRLHGGLIAAGTVGLLGGGLIGSHIDIPKSRVWLLHAGGAAGVGLGVAMAYIIKGDDLSLTGATIGGISGAAVGMGVTAALTRNMHRRKRPIPVNLSITPSQDGVFASVSGHLR